MVPRKPRTMRTGMVSPAAARGSSTLGICSTNDRYLDGERMKMSDRFVKGPWRYEQIEGVSHWIPVDAPDQLNQLLIEWLG